MSFRNGGGKKKSPVRRSPSTKSRTTVRRVTKSPVRRSPSTKSRTTVRRVTKSPVRRSMSHKGGDNLWEIWKPMNTNHRKLVPEEI